DAHLLFPIRLHHAWMHCPHPRPRPGARAAAARRVLLRELRVRLRRQGGDVRAGDVGVARAAAAHGGSLPAGAARDRRRVRTRHPFTLLTLAAALPTLAWLLPAPAGALGTAVVAFGLAAAAGVRRVLVPAVVTAAPFWLFLFVLHDLPTTLAIGLRITTMVAGFVWLAAVLAPDRLVEAMVARGWSVTVAYVFAATLSAVPLFRARARRIVEAQRCRGLPPRCVMGRSRSPRERSWRSSGRSGRGRPRCCSSLRTSLRGSPVAGSRGPCAGARAVGSCCRRPGRSCRGWRSPCGTRSHSGRRTWAGLGGRSRGTWSARSSGWRSRRSR